MKKTIFTILFLLISLFIVDKLRDFVHNNNKNIKNDPVACTMDAMMCPDGTYVGRSGPKCEFKCPEIIASTTVISTILQASFGLNESFEFNGVQMKVLSIQEDSRCPSDVQCIQAGRVRIALNVGTTTEELEIGKLISINGLNISLDEVNPYPNSKQKIQDSEYRFSFTIKPI